MREINKRGLDLIRRFEGVRNTVYKDAVGLPTVGVGHLIRPGDNLKVGDRITDEQVDAFLRADLADAERAIERLVKVPISDDQFAALVSLTFNIGVGAFERSTLLRRLNAGDYEGATREFAKWNKAGGKPLAGLTRRRRAEADLFDDDEEGAPHAKADDVEPEPVDAREPTTDTPQPTTDNRQPTTEVTADVAVVTPAPAAPGTPATAASVEATKSTRMHVTAIASAVWAAIGDKLGQILGLPPDVIRLLIYAAAAAALLGLLYEGIRQLLILVIRSRPDRENVH